MIITKTLSFFHSLEGKSNKFNKQPQNFTESVKHPKKTENDRISTKPSMHSLSVSLQRRVLKLFFFLCLVFFPLPSTSFSFLRLLSPIPILFFLILLILSAITNFLISSVFSATERRSRTQFWKRLENAGNCTAIRRRSRRWSVLHSGEDAEEPESAQTESQSQEQWTWKHGFSFEEQNRCLWG